MEPVFNNPSDFIPYSIFKQHMVVIGLFLDKKTVNHFSALSKYFNNLLNNPKSDFGRMFWKTLAVKNDGIKCYKSKTINYKFKQMMKVFGEIKKNMKPFKYTGRNMKCICENCGNGCFPERFDRWSFDNPLHCNCEILKCDSKVTLIKSHLTLEKKKIKRSKKALVLQMRKLNEKMEDLLEKEKKANSIHHLVKMKPAFENIKENSPYKSTREQAKKALKEIGKFDSWFCCERINKNFNVEFDDDDDDDF